MKQPLGIYVFIAQTTTVRASPKAQHDRHILLDSGCPPPCLNIGHEWIVPLQNSSQLFFSSWYPKSPSLLSLTESTTLVLPGLILAIMWVLHDRTRLHKKIGCHPTPIILQNAKLRNAMLNHDWLTVLTSPENHSLDPFSHEKPNPPTLPSHTQRRRRKGSFRRWKELEMKPWGELWGGSINHHLCQRIGSFFGRPCGTQTWLAGISH